MEKMIARVCFALGAILLIVRIAPVISRKPEEVSFPPAGTAELIILARSAGDAWPLAHLLGLIAVVLLGAGYWLHGMAFRAVDRRLMSVLVPGLATLGLGAFAVALSVDGWLVYDFALAEHTEATAAAHAFAIDIFAAGIFILMTAMLSLGLSMTHGRSGRRVAGWAGVGIAGIAILAYWTGVAGPNWSNMQIGGSLIMLMFLWHLIVGAFGWSWPE